MTPGMEGKHSPHGPAQRIFHSPAITALPRDAVELTLDRAYDIEVARAYDPGGRFTQRRQLFNAATHVRINLWG